MMRLIAAFCFLSSLTAAEPANWSQPFPAHKIAANLYYVGTADLACFLIATPQGHILINSGLAESTPLIRKSVADLGFRFEDIRLILITQAHFDHAAALSEIRKLTGAKVAATTPDAPLLEDGGTTDYLFGARYRFAPVKVDRILKDGEAIELGGTELKVHVTPGHTKGSATYTLDAVESGRTYHVVIANMGSINPGTKLVDNPKYPQIASDYAHGFEVQKSLPCDIWVASHASQYSLAKKYKPQYDPANFVDPAGYQAAVARYEAEFRRQLAEQQQRKKGGAAMSVKQ
jgi:metallo-beta-lactamase class B